IAECPSEILNAWKPETCGNER
ncbi:hypothetical protein CEXT_802451, partial [Caerostris extrusa]